MEDLVEVRLIQPVKACRIFHGWDKRKQERKGRKGDGGGHRHAGTGCNWERWGRDKKGSIKPKISMREVYTDKIQAIMKQKDIEHRTRLS